jgi:hypothetical protein
VDELDLAEARERLGVGRQAGRVPAVVAGELARQVGRGLTRQRAEVQGAVLCCVLFWGLCCCCWVVAQSWWSARKKGFRRMNKRLGDRLIKGGALMMLMPFDLDS